MLHQSHIVAQRLHLLVNLQAAPAKTEGVVPTLQDCFGRRLEGVDLALLCGCRRALAAYCTLLQHNGTQPELGSRTCNGES